MRSRRCGLGVVTAAVLVVLPAAAVPGPSAGGEGGGWVPLFNGKNFDGWHQPNGWARYEIEDGTIVGTTAEGSPNSFLCTKKLYSDFELEFEVNLDPRLNSGVQIRSNSFPEYRKGRVHGYQVEIATNGTAGFIYDEARRGWLSMDRSDPKARAAFQDGEWNRFRIVCRGDAIKTWVNGVPVADLADDMTRTGFIGLQVHGFRGDRPAQVRWRNIRIRELEAPPPEAKGPDRVQALIDEVEKACKERTVHMIGREKAVRLAELVRRARPQVVVECGTAIGYSGLWIARELKNAGHGRLITIEISPDRAMEAEGYFRRAGFGDIVTVEVGDAREVVKGIKGRVDFAFIDCGYGNYSPCLEGLEGKLRDGAVIVADNVGIGAGGMADYLEAVRSRYLSRTEWFELGLPWAKRDAMEISIASERADPRVQAVIDELEKESLGKRPYVPIIGQEKAERLAELIRKAKPRLVVEGGTAQGYSGLWIARELQAAGQCKLITIEINPKTAGQADVNFRRAGLDGLITILVGDAREVVKTIDGPIGFVFLDCEGSNYLPCLKGLEKNLAAGATVVADNVGVQKRQTADYMEYVQSRYESRTEWFDVDLPWGKRDAIEVTVIKGGKNSSGGNGPSPDNVAPPGFTALFNGRDFTGWKVPEGDGGHWKVIDGVIDYDAQSEAKGDKSLWSVREFGDFVLHVDWRIKETPYVNPGVPYILPDGTHARDIHGNEMRMALPDSDSGIFLRGSGKNQVNIWCWPIGSGEFYGYRMDRSQPPEIRAGVTPRTQADKPVGQWNRFEITLRGDRVTVVLNGKLVIDNARLPGIAPKGAIGLQHHGGKRDGKWVGPPSLLQFKNIFIQELEE